VSAKKNPETAYPVEEPGLSPVFGGFHVAHLFSFLCCAFFVSLVFVLYLVSKVASVSGLSILGCPLFFSSVYCKLKITATYMHVLIYMSNVTNSKIHIFC